MLGRVRVLARNPARVLGYPRSHRDRYIDYDAGQCCKAHWDHSWCLIYRDLDTCFRCRIAPVCTPYCYGSRERSFLPSRPIHLHIDCDPRKRRRKRCPHNALHWSSLVCCGTPHDIDHCSTVLRRNPHPLDTWKHYGHIHSLQTPKWAGSVEDNCKQVCD